jgi:quercetin dioxygenase-like cupin family protein
MKLSRRDCYRLLPALAVTVSAGFPAPAEVLPSKAARYEDLPVRTSGENSFRSILEGKTHEGFPIEAHATELAPGALPHPGHRHRHEEMFLIREGTVELTIEGKATRLAPGSVAFIASNEEHAIHNVGSTRAKYFVIALGHDA